MTTKKMKIEDLEPKDTSSKNVDAINKLKKAQASADKILDDMGTEHEFEIKSECLDKQGNKTKVLVINTDKEGYIGLFLELGNPYSLNAKGEEKEDGSKLMRYIEFMSNIDLTDTDNQGAVGIKASGKARSVIANFFALNLVSAIDVASVTAE